MLHHVVAFVEGSPVHDGHGEPLPQEPGPHGGGTAVDDIYQRHPVLASAQALEDFQVAEGESVHPHELPLVYAGYAADVPQAAVFGLFKVEDQGPGRAEGQGIVLHPEALEASDSQLLLELIGGGVLYEGPLVEGRDVGAGELVAYGFRVVAAHHQFLGGEGLYEGMDVIEAALGHLEGAGAHVEEGGAAAIVGVEGQPAQIVVLLLLEHAFAEGYARRKYLGDTAFHQLVLYQFRVFQLVADGHFVSGPYKLGEILLYGMMRHPGHLHRAFLAVGTVGEHQPQHLACKDGVVGVCFIEIPYPVKQYGLGVQRLGGEVLLEHRGVFRGFCHNLQI